MEFEELIRERSSTRKFKSEPISDQALNKILEAGNLAPTARNIQPQRILVVRSKEGLEKIDRVCPCRYNAPVSLIVCSNKEEAFSKVYHSTYEMDACIVATHMMLEATNLGIANIWIEKFDAPELTKEFNLEDNIIPICILNLGYKADDCPESVTHTIRKNIDDVVKYI